MENQHLPSSSSSPIIDALELAEKERGTHAHGSISYKSMRRFEQLLPHQMDNTLETGCGRSTIFFSQASKNHLVFCLDDLEYGEESSVKYFLSSRRFNPKSVTCVYGPTQKTLPEFKHSAQYDCVLIDGPHGYPFPELEYFHVYPHIKPGGFLLLDDVQIPTIGRMADILQEDAMWHFVELMEWTAVFQRTDAPVFPSDGDHWWEQNYNRRRTDTKLEFHLNDSGAQMPFAEKLRIQEKLKIEQKRSAAKQLRKKRKRGTLRRWLNKIRMKP